ncbi:polyprenyl synthetase family protein [Comamonas endophytica]|uniref:Polyprenyl synthetase family protein n=1 Tax=Comamonas endophytica TaxID=2949090 RepID=A0ABY6GEW4_9BURK|nr:MULTISPECIES: polyprenyl synthetase family protein [unclassified Acidovorax]MCD2513207.1 polyprenyl synthetase family protein [Acidovorax sp. D4N7]UYG53448.1 polyprenyl synthetase family protein [Acidovorax sp. 5MLIR]
MLASPVLSPSSATAALPRDSAQERLIDGLRAQIDARLGVLVPVAHAQENRVAAAMRYGVLAPGKRVRPLLMLLAARGFGVDPGDVLDAACALEMVHAASLFLDDMPCMDDAKLRRNQPTVHVAFGEDVAMLAAVALLASAWRITATAGGIPPLVRTDMVTVLSDAVGINGLVTGQYLDLHATGPARTTPQIAQTNQQKTGALFTAAFELAGLAAGANTQTRALMREAAEALGQAFQLADDLADGEMEASVLGKDCQQDVGKATLVALVGPSSTRRILARHVQRAETLFAQAMPGDDALALLTRSIFAPQRR